MSATIGSWLNDDATGYERTRDIEDRLSDALHERLVERFVTRRRSIAEIPASARSYGRTRRREGEDGNPFLVLEGLRERLLDRPEAPSTRALDRRPRRGPARGLSARTRPGRSSRARVSRRARARRESAATRAQAHASLELDGGQRLRLSRRLLAWSRDMVQEVVGSLSGGALHAWSPRRVGSSINSSRASARCRGPRRRPSSADLTASDRRGLSELGVNVGRLVIWSSDSLRPRQRMTRLALSQACEPLDPELLAPLSRRVSFAVHRGLPEAWLNRAGFVVLGQRAVRADLLERVSRELNERAPRRAVRITSDARPVARVQRR